MTAGDLATWFAEFAAGLLVGWWLGFRRGRYVTERALGIPLAIRDALERR